MGFWFGLMVGLFVAMAVLSTFLFRTDWEKVRTSPLFIGGCHGITFLMFFQLLFFFVGDSIGVSESPR